MDEEGIIERDRADRAELERDQWQATARQLKDQVDQMNAAFQEIWQRDWQNAEDANAVRMIVDSTLRGPFIPAEPAA